MVNTVRVRFAPSPTGFMHLGNVRAAFINYLFARQKNGDFILRIEDTDAQRNIDPDGQRIISDLNWLKLGYQEGPIIGGPYAPYYQSQRASIYQHHLTILKERHAIYRCFCTTEELEQKRNRQIALKQPPRYDRTCMRYTHAEVEQKLAENESFIWRFKLDNNTLHVTDLARGMVTYDLKHFSDFPLTRADGSFTFIFANFVDDLVMKITHIIRGEDHLTNTANQAALYKIFDAPIPTFWHLPIICNAEGKKLSKRDFGFSLDDLRIAGFIPEAIVNYLAIIGTSFEHEIMDINELTKTFNFDHIASTGHIKYDLEKLRWVNHKWINKLSLEDLTLRCRDILEPAYPTLKNITDSALQVLIKPFHQELITLNDIVPLLKFYFEEPLIEESILFEYHYATHKEILQQLIHQYSVMNLDPEQLVTAVNTLCKMHGIKAKDIYALLRIALTGSPQGPGLKDLIALLGHERTIQRLQDFIQV